MAGTTDLAGAAEILGVHYQTAYRWVREGKLPAKRIRNRYVVATADIEAFERARNEAQPPEPTTTRREWPEVADRLFDNLIDGDEAKVEEAVVRLHRQGEPIADIITELFVPTLRRIGEGWRAGTVSMAEEHRASAILTRVLASVDQRRRGRPRGLVVIATPSGDRHELPPAMAAAALRSDGWRVELLGADLPAVALADFVGDADPDLVVLTVTNPEAADTARETATMLQPSGVPVLIGGPGRTLDDLLDLARETKAERKRTEPVSDDSSV